MRGKEIENKIYNETFLLCSAPDELRFIVYGCDLHQSVGLLVLKWVSWEQRRSLNTSFLSSVSAHSDFTYKIPYQRFYSMSLKLKLNADIQSPPLHESEVFQKYIVPFSPWSHDF